MAFAPRSGSRVATLHHGDDVTSAVSGKVKRPGGVVLLKDLIPLKDPKGGARTKTVFGERPPAPDAGEKDPSGRKQKPRKG